MRVLNGQARYEIAETEKMSVFHGVLHYRIWKRTKKTLNLAPFQISE